EALGAPAAATDPVDAFNAIDPALAPPAAAVPDGIPLSVISTPPIAPRPAPRPRPPIVPERTETGYRTACVILDRPSAGSCYLTIHPEKRPPQTIYLTAQALDH